MADIYDRHLFLYAKGWYKKTDTYRDVKAIIAERNALLPEYIHQGDIENVLLEFAWEYLKSRNAYFFKEFLYSCHIRGVIDSCLGIMSITSKDEIGFDLGAPDPKILPLSER